MKLAFTYYKEIHKQYLWLHALSLVIFLWTSVFWFILPFYIINYGQYLNDYMIQLLLVLILLFIPAIVLTIHCWFISFQAARQWKRQNPAESVWKWVLRFQTMAFTIVILFTVFIYTTMFVIDFFR